MNREEILYLVPYLISLALSFGVLLYSWRHRAVRGASAYTWFVGGQTLSIFGFIMKLLSPDLQSKILWDKFLWIVQGTVIIVAFLAFAIQFTEYKVKHSIRFWVLVLAVPTIFNLLVITDNLHHLIYPNPQLIVEYPFPDLNYSYTFVVYILALYVYITTLFGIGLLLRRALRPQNLYRAQLIIMATGFFVPVAFSILAVFSIKVAPQRDATPFTLAIGNLIVAWGLFHYRVFDIVPIARERVLENINDAVFVVDALGRIVDINRAALAVLGKTTAQVIGQPSRLVFGEWPNLVEQFKDVDGGFNEISIQVRGDTHYYDLSISPLYDGRKRLLGHVFVLHDITKRKTLEDGYRQLSERLEQRFKERTEELRESAEQYRAVVQNQTEFIVRWKPDHQRTFINDAYCRYYGLTMEQAMQVDFLSFIAEEDREKVEAKISRLVSGATDVETEIHRVIKPDGAIVWQEWTDQAIRNEYGQVVEFQSVGRDVTQRKRSEEALLKAEEKYRNIFENTIEAITQTSLDGKFITANPAAARLLGYNSPEELIASVAEIERQFYVDPRRREEFISLMKEHENMTGFESEVYRKDGSTIWISENSRVVRDKNGTFLYYEGTTVDITARKRAEELLRESEQRYKTLFEIAPIQIFTKDRSGKYTSSNAENNKYWRANRIGYTDADLYGFEETREIRRMDQHVMETGKDITFEQLVETDIGPVTLLTSKTPLRDAQGNIIGLLTTSVDISARKRAEEELAVAYDTTLEGWAKALELRDKETEGHSRRVTELSMKLARAAGVNKDDLIHIYRGAIIHDIGKMAVPDEVLRKADTLTPSEWEIIRKHPTTAYELLSPIPYLKKALEIPYCHHEKWDGSGYPQGLKGEEIPLSARIFAVVDVWDAVQSDRPYNKAWPVEKTIAYMKEQSGKYFDPNIVKVFLELQGQGEI